MVKTKVRPQGSQRGPGGGSDTLPPRPRWGDGNGEHMPDRAQTARLGLYIFLGALAMMFGALALMYLLRLPDRDAYVFELPRLTWFGTALLMVSSITCQMTLHAARREKTKLALRGVWLTLGLGTLFLVFQFVSWADVARQLAGNPSHFFSALFYVFTALHGVHLFGGLVWLGLMGWHLISQPKPNPLTIELGTTYWHFLGVLWVVLFGLMLLK
ncbi:MAG: cytochrome c oxidase subunit 3 [Fimbriimonadales bacterium]